MGGATQSVRGNYKSFEGIQLSLYIYIIRRYKSPLQDGVDSVPRGRRKSRKGNTGVLMICTGFELHQC